MFINFQEKQLVSLDNKLEKINKKVLEKSDLETTLQGENLITLIQKKEKELENVEIGKKAQELKKLIETLKKTTKVNLEKKLLNKVQF